MPNHIKNRAKSRSTKKIEDTMFYTNYGLLYKKEDDKPKHMLNRLMNSS